MNKSRFKRGMNRIALFLLLIFWVPCLGVVAHSYWVKFKVNAEITTITENSQLDTTPKNAGFDAMARRLATRPKAANTSSSGDGKFQGPAFKRLQAQAAAHRAKEALKKQLSQADRRIENSLVVSAYALLLFGFVQALSWIIQGFMKDEP